MSVFTLKNKKDLSEIYKDEKQFCQILMHDGLLKESQKCCNCGSNMSLHQKKNVVEWRCRKNRTNDCSTKSVRSGSWFSNSRLSFLKIFQILLMHISESSNREIIKELGMSSRTVVQFRCLFRKLCTQIVSKYSHIGGHGKVVEIDKIEVEGRRYGRENVDVPKIWILGGVCKNTSEVFATVVENRTAQSLIESLKSNVHRDSIINSDGSADYSEVGKVFRHNIVNIIRLNDTHATSIKELWDHLEEPIMANIGTSLELLPLYMGEAVVRINAKEEFLKMLLEEMVNEVNEKN